MHISAPHSPQQNPAEGIIQEICKKWNGIMHAKSVITCFWDYGMEWVCEVAQRTVSSSRHAEGQTPLKLLLEISLFLDFGFYAGLGPTALGRFLGVSHRIGNMMSFWVLGVTGRVVSRTTVQRITNLELKEESMLSSCKEFGNAIKHYYDDGNNQVSVDSIIPYFDLPNGPILNDPAFQEEFGNVLANDAIPEADFTPDAYDQYLHMEIALPRGEDCRMEYARVTKRLCDNSGTPIGVANNNPVLDTWAYEVEWYDGHREQMFANTIAENLFAQVDDEGNRHVLFKDIVAHQYSDKAMTEVEAIITARDGRCQFKPTTKGWEVCIEWKDGSTNWIPLKDAKDSYPVQLAEYAIAHNQQDRPVFAWWVPFVMKKRNHIISKVKSKYWICSHKFGIEIPKTVKHALELDRRNFNTLWWDAIMQEMNNVRNCICKVQS
jgi:hypothetical protein